MATKEQWEAKIKSWVPEWYYQDKVIESAIIASFARVFSQLETDIRDEFAQTFIDQAIGGYLAVHGAERGVTQKEGESVEDFRIRVKTAGLKTQVDPVSIKSIVDSFLETPCIVIEDAEGALFADRGLFCDRGDIVIDPLIDNAFTVIVENQSDLAKLQSIVDAVNAEKAEGVLWRLVEKYVHEFHLTEDGDMFVTEDGDELVAG